MPDPRERTLTPEERRALFARPLSSYDDSLGGLIPSLIAESTPGSDARGALVETEDWGAFGGPVGRELAAAAEERRRRIVEERALQRMAEAHRSAGDPRRGDMNAFFGGGDASEIDPDAPAPGSAEWFRASQDPTRAEGLFDVHGSPMIQPGRGLGRQLGVRPQSAVAEEEFARSPGVAAALNMGDVLTLPRVAIGAAGDESYDANQRALDEVLERGREEHPMASAGGALVGIIPQLMAPAALGEAALTRMAGAPVGAEAARLATPALTRVGAAGLEGALYGLGHGLSTGDPDRAASEALAGGAFGAGLSGAAQGVGHAVSGLPARVPGLEEAAQRLRLRAAGGRTVPVQRALDALPGGAEGVAADLDRLGISPRYSVHSVDDARAAADRVRSRAGRNLDRVFETMAEAEANGAGAQARDRALAAIASDDATELMLGAPPDSPERELGRRIIEGRVGRHRTASLDVMEAEAERAAQNGPLSRPESTARLRAQLERMGVDPAAIEQETKRNIRGAARQPLSPRDVAELRHRDDVTGVFGPEGRRRLPASGASMPASVPPRSPEEEAALRALADELFPASTTTPSVDVDPVAQALDEIAQSYAGVPSGAEGRSAAEVMARDYRATGGRMPFGRPSAPGRPGTGAQREVELLDEGINYTPGANQVNNRMGALQRDLRTVRQSLRGQMDAAVSAVDPELGAMYPQERRDYQLGSVFGRLGQDNARREAANRLVSPTDYAAGMAGNGSLLQRAAQAAANRLFRGREASLAATAAEHASDAFGRAPDLRAPAAAVSERAGRMLPAPVMPQPPQEERPARGLSDQEFRSLVDSGAPVDAPPAPSPAPSGPEPVDLSDDELDEFMGL